MPGEHSGTMVKQLKGGKGKAPAANPFADQGNPFMNAGLPISLATPQWAGPVQQQGADLSLFPQSQNYNWHGGIGTPVAPQTDPVGAYTYGNTSPNDLLSQINSLYSGGTPNFTGEANKQAAAIYKPVLDDLTHQAGAAKKNSQYNDAQLKAMYAALQGSIGADGKKMAQQNSQNVASLQQTGKQNVASIGQEYGNAANEAASVMAKLGIQAAAPDALPRGAEHEALLQGIAQLNTGAATNLAKQTGQDALNFNTAQKNIAGFEGTQNRGANQRNLTSTLNSIGTERAQVGSQQAQQSAGFMQHLQDQYINSVNQRASALTQMYSQQQQMAMAQQQNQMEMMKFEKSLMPSAYQQWQMTPTADKLASYAGQLFGAGGNQASSALNFVQSMGGQHATNALDFANQVAMAAQNAQDPNIRSLSPNQLKALAMQAYQQMGVNPNINNYVGSMNQGVPGQ